MVGIGDREFGINPAILRTIGQDAKAPVVQALRCAETGRSMPGIHGPVWLGQPPDGRDWRHHGRHQWRPFQCECTTDEAPMAGPGPAIGPMSMPRIG
jgi:hypothetical protein